jgi:hypothetical protein
MRHLPFLTLLLLLSACAAQSLPQEDPWVRAPRVFATLEDALPPLAEVLWRPYEDRVKAAQGQRVRKALQTVGVGSFSHERDGLRYAFSQRVERALARPLEARTGLTVYDRATLERWEEDFMVSAAGFPSHERVMRPYTFDASREAAEYVGLDTVVMGQFFAEGPNLVLRAELIRLGSGKAGKGQRLSRAEVLLDLDAVPLHEFLGPLPARPHGSLVPPPEPWVQSPISVWYEILEANGDRRRGVQGTPVADGDAVLSQFMVVRPVHVLVVRLDSEGDLQVLFPDREASGSDRVEVGKRYIVVDHVDAPPKVAIHFVLYSEEPMNFQRDIFEAVSALQHQVRAGAEREAVASSLLLPPGIHQVRLWFTFG